MKNNQTEALKERRAEMIAGLYLSSTQLLNLVPDSSGEFDFLAIGHDNPSCIMAVEVKLVQVLKKTMLKNSIEKVAERIKPSWGFPILLVFVNSEQNKGHYLLLELQQIQDLKAALSSEDKKAQLAALLKDVEASVLDVEALKIRLQPFFKD